MATILREVVENKNLVSRQTGSTGVVESTVPPPIDLDTESSGAFALPPPTDLDPAAVTQGLSSSTSTSSNQNPVELGTFTKQGHVVRNWKARKFFYHPDNNTIRYEDLSIPPTQKGQFSLADFRITTISETPLLISLEILPSKILYTLRANDSNSFKRLREKLEELSTRNNCSATHGPSLDQTPTPESDERRITRTRRVLIYKNLPFSSIVFVSQCASNKGGVTFYVRKRSPSGNLFDVAKAHPSVADRIDKVYQVKGLIKAIQTADWLASLSYNMQPEDIHNLFRERVNPLDSLAHEESFSALSAFSGCILTPTGFPFRHNYDIDLVFVHGLDGNLQATWTSDNKCWWPAALAGILRSHPSKSRNCRILLVKHKLCLQDALAADTFEGVSQKIIDACQNALVGQRVGKNDPCPKPVIWLTHCLGGLLVQNVLKSSRELRQATAGVVFLGTPHLGTPVAEVLMNASNFATSYEESKALQALVPNAHAELLPSFLTFHIPFLNLYESKQLDSPLPGLPRSNGMRIVLESSGNLNEIEKKIALPQFNRGRCLNEQVPDSDHLSISHFSSPPHPNRLNDNEFPTFRTILKSVSSFLKHYDFDRVIPNQQLSAEEQLDTRQQIDQKLSSFNLELCIPQPQIGSDHNSQFSAVAYLLGFDPQKVRKDAIAWLRKNERFCLSATPVHQFMNGRTFGQYCSDMENADASGDYVTLIAVSKAFEREIHILALPVDDQLSTIINHSPREFREKLHLLQLSGEKFEPLRLLSHPTSSSSV